MQKDQMKELLTHELGDLLFAEQRFLSATKQLAKEVMEPEIQRRVEKHVKETEGQIDRLKKAFKAIDEPAKAETCEGALGIQEEHASFKKEEQPDKEMLSAFNLGSGLRVEHYEIAAYETALAIARALGERECVDLLQESLKEEKEMARFLQSRARRTLKGMIEPERGSNGESRSSANGRSRTSGNGRTSRSSSARSGKSDGRRGSRSRGRGGDSNSAITTRDHDEIREWVEARGGIPTIVDRTGGVLRIDFIEGKGSGGREERLKETDWNRWFEIFDDRSLSFLHSPEPESRFVKLIRE